METNLKHPYFDVINIFIPPTDLVSICLTYLPLKLCIKCGKLYVGLICARCDFRIEEEHHTQITTYVTEGDMEKVCESTGGYSKGCMCWGSPCLFCFKPTLTNLTNDIELINY